MKQMVVVCAAAVCAAGSVLGVDYTWQGGSGAFTNALLWSPAGVPAVADNAKFTTASDAAVTWTESVSNNTMIASSINGNTLVLDLGGNAYTLTNRFYFEGDKASSYVVVSNGFLTVATNTCDVKINAGVAPARLTFSAGAVAALSALSTWRSDVNVETGAAVTCNSEVKIGDGTANSMSALNVNGGTLTLNNHLWINGGNNSTSVLSIADGSVVSKKYFSIGNGGSGTAWGVLNLSGGYLETQSDVWLGNAGTARGVANISGGLWVPKAQFEVAHGGSTVSWLNLSGGEIVMPVSGKNFIVANNGNGQFTTGTVSMTGGKITVTNGAAMNFGNASNGLGRCFLGGTGFIFARDFKLGTVRTGRGECTVTGGLLRAENYIGVGSAAGGDGAMVVNSGEVSAKQVKIGDSAGGTGSLVMSNGLFHTDAQFYVGSAGTGTFYIAGGTLLISNDFSLGQNGTGNGNVVMTDGNVLTTTNLKDGDWGGQGMFTLQGGTLTCVSSAIVGNGNGSTGTLSITGGQLVTYGYVSVANNATGAKGTLLVSGGSLVASNSLTFGSSVTNWGYGVVTGGSVLSSAITVGNSGFGDLVQSNGTVTATTSLTLGNAVGGTGSVTVAGGLMHVKGSTYVANSGRGSLIVSGGQLVASNSLSCASAYGSTGYMALAGGTVLAKGGEWGRTGIAQVDISGGTNTFTGAVNIGVYTQSVLNISGGSNTFSGVGVARNFAGSSATMTVSGGKTWVNGYLDVGQFGPGTLVVAGGELTTPYLRINTGSTTSPVPPQSEVRITGGRLLVTGACYMPDTATITGKLTLAGGTLAVPVLRQHWGKLHVLFDGGTVEATKAEPDFIRELDKFTLTGNGLVVDSAGYAIGSALVFPDAAGEHGRLVKKGAGTFTLNAASTFTGPVVVNAGELALSSSGLITLAGGCQIDGGALLNLSARNMDFTLPAGTASRIDGELRLASGRSLVVTNGATLSGTGTVARVVLLSGATLARAASAGSAVLHVGELVIPAGAVIALSGYTVDDLKNGIPLVAGGSLSVAQGGSVIVKIDDVAQSPVALRVEGGVLTAQLFNPGTLIRVQ